MASPGLEHPRARRRGVAGAPRVRTRVVRSRPTGIYARLPARRGLRNPVVRRVAFVFTLLALGTLALLWWSRTWVEAELAQGGGSVGGTTVIALPSAVAPDRPIVLEVHPAAYAERATVTLAGVPVAGVYANAGRLTIRLQKGLPEGGYELAVAFDRPLLLGPTVARWPVVVDDQPPSIAKPLLIPGPIDSPARVSGAIEPGATVRVETTSAEPPRVDVADGTYTLLFARPPSGPVVVVATDLAGNEARLRFEIPIAYPTDTRAVHVTAAGWADPGIRQRTLALVDAGVVNVVQLDLKDEDGRVGYDSAVPFARTIGSVEGQYRLADAVATLRAHNARVIGRIVAFRDPVLARWAWANGHPDWVLQTPTGQALDAYGGFTNYTVAEVRSYNLAIAVEAAGLGVGDILWDYVRRPEGDPLEMVVPGLSGTTRTTGDAIVDFLAESHLALRRAGAYQGASLFGIAATRPENIGQPVDRIARNVDYIAPMVYPSHYVDGECGVRSPIRQPYDIVRCSLGDFVRVMAGTGAVLVPWLQDFSLGPVGYGADEVAEQVRATRDVGAAGFLLWNPAARYTYDGR